MRRALAVLTVVMLAVSGALLAPGPAEAAPDGAAASAAGPADTPLRYVALGDSYSAASGVLPLDPTAPLPCLRSTRNYPHVLAERLGAALVDVTCGAAESGDLTASQYPGIAPQVDALRPDTQLVTLTIGGNDSGVFIGAILRCGALGTIALGQGSPCAAAFGDSFERTVRDTTYPALVAALSAVRQRAPQARVMVIGYPWILPATGGCFPQMPIATGDVPYLRSLQATLNDAVARAAAATGSTFVDTAPASEGRDACAPLGTRWIEPAVLGTNPVIVHLNAQGEAGLAGLVLASLARTDPAVVAGAGSRIPTRITQRAGRAEAGSRGRLLRVTLRTTAGTRVPGARLVLQSQRLRGARGWSTVRSVTTGEDGRATTTVRPRARTAYRWRLRATPLLAGTRSTWLVLGPQGSRT